MLDKLVVAVRPRALWEAMDLGIVMTRKWAKNLYLSWLILTLPFFIVFTSVLGVAWGIFLFWWLKPLFDRMILYYFSKCTFGVQPTVRENLASLRDVFKTQIILSLTLMRLFDWSRSFVLPVRQLEGLKGSKSRKRMDLLKKRNYGSNSVLMIMAYLKLELLLAIIPLFFVYLNLESGMIFAQINMADFFVEFWRLFFQQGAPYFWLSASAVYVAMTVIEPMYVGSGFSLYLNQRAELESWDIEIIFRKLAKRLEQNRDVEIEKERTRQHKKKAGLARRGLLSILLAFCCWPALNAQAMPDPVAQEEMIKKDIKEIVSSQKYGAEKEQIIKEPKEKKQNRNNSSSNGSNGNRDWGVWGGFLEVIVYLILIFGVIGLVMYFVTMWKGRDSDDMSEHAPPETLFGMDIRPDSLPDNIPTQAWALWQQGKTTEAMSLLYRGALVFLAHQDSVKLSKSNTEGDCMALAMRHLKESSANHFVGIAQTWQMVAYAHRQPDDVHFQDLCRNYDAAFGGEVMLP